MRDRTKIRTGKRIMAVMLSLAMIFGIFSGIKLDAEAAGTTYAFDELEVGKVLYVNDKIKFVSSQLDDKNCSYICTTIYIQSENNSAQVMHQQISSKYDSQVIDISSPLYGEKTYKKYKIEKYSHIKADPSTPEGGMRIEYFYIYLTPLEDDKNGTLSESDSAASSSSIPFHTCNFQWATTIDPTTGADGLEEYKCVECGAVQESHPIPASVAAVKDFYGKVKDAPANGTVTYDSGKLYTISDYLLKKMSERNDVTITVNFEYQNAKYELTFPAGTDYTPVLTDEETMYGYFGVAAKLGLTVVAK